MSTSLARVAFGLSWLALAGCGGTSPHAAPPAELTIAGDDSPSGIFDPSVVREAGERAWMSYSSVDYHGRPLVQDVGIRIARSDDGGLTWTSVRTVATPAAAAVADPDPAHGLCGQPVCTGRWVYETSWLVQDPTDEPARRWKLYAHQYFLRAESTPALQYHLGAIVTWAAASPDQLGGASATALRWNLTPGSFTGGVNVNALHPELAGCVAVAEGGASARPGALDLVLTCPYAVEGVDPLPQKIVLLRSSDHGASFRHVATLLAPPDAAGVPGASFFSAPSLLPGDGPDPVLIVTPSKRGTYSGCAVIPFADVSAGTLVRDGGLPRIRALAPVDPGVHGGACAWDRGLDRMGMLMSRLDPAESPPRFRIVRTGLAP